jgi:hypothetical protein
MKHDLAIVDRDTARRLYTNGIHNDGEYAAASTVFRRMYFKDEASGDGTDMDKLGQAMSIYESEGSVELVAECEDYDEPWTGDDDHDH